MASPLEPNQLKTSEAFSYWQMYNDETLDPRSRWVTINGGPNGCLPLLRDQREIATLLPRVLFNKINFNSDPYNYVPQHGGFTIIKLISEYASESATPEISTHKPKSAAVSSATPPSTRSDPVVTASGLTIEDVDDPVPLSVPAPKVKAKKPHPVRKALEDKTDQKEEKSYEVAAASVPPPTSTDIVSLSSGYPSFDSDLATRDDPLNLWNLSRRPTFLSPPEDPVSTQPASPPPPVEKKSSLTFRATVVAVIAIAAIYLITKFTSGK